MQEITKVHCALKIPNYVQIKLAHGFNKGKITQSDIISTVDSGMDKWHTLLGEMGGVAIKNNNSKGYAIAQKGDGIDISSRMQYHRGTVQKGLSQTIKTACEVGVLDEM